MNPESAFALVVPAMLVLLATGALAGHIERAVYQFAAAGPSDEATGGALLESKFSKSRLEFTRLRDERARLEEELAQMQKERASLADQERQLADRQKNFVSEVNYPTPGASGFYFKIEGPSAVMPFAGIASQATALGGKRHVRLIVWGMAQTEAQNMALNWAGNDGKIILAREFSGSLFWHEA